MATFATKPCIQQVAHLNVQVGHHCSAIRIPVLPSYPRLRRPEMAADGASLRASSTQVPASSLCRAAISAVRDANHNRLRRIGNLPVPETSSHGGLDVRLCSRSHWPALRQHAPTPNASSPGFDGENLKMITTSAALTNSKAVFTSAGSIAPSRRPLTIGRLLKVMARPIRSD